MLELRQTETFRTWWMRLKDERARGLIFSRLERLAYGHTGDIAAVGEGVSELRIHYGPGYRVYFRKRGDRVIPPALRRRQRQPSQGHQEGKAARGRMERLICARNLPPSIRPKA